MYNVEIDYNSTDLSSYEEAWEKIFISGNHEPSVSFEWTNALVSTHLHATDKFCILKINKGESIQGLIPLVTRQESIGPLSFATLFPLSEAYNTHSDLLLIKQQPDILESFYKAIFNLDFNWDIFRVGRLLENNQFLKIFSKCNKHKNELYRTRYEQPSFFLHLPETYNEYLLSRSSKFRNYLKRKSKKLHQCSELKFSIVKDIDALNRCYGHLLDIEEKSWKHNHGTAISAIERQKFFYKALCYEALKKNRLHLLLMYDGDKPIAYNLGIILCNCYYYIKTSYDHDYRLLSPATVLRASLIESLIAEGVTTFDFPGEPYEWEQQWTNDLRWHKSLVIFNNGLKPKILYALMHLRDILKKKKNIKDLSFCDPKALKSSAN